LRVYDDLFGLQMEAIKTTSAVPEERGVQQGKDIGIRNKKNLVLLSFSNTDFNLQGRVVRKPINANPGLNVVQGFCFSCLKAFPVLILRDNLKAPKVKFQSENKLQKSTPLS